MYLEFCFICLSNPKYKLDYFFHNIAVVFSLTFCHRFLPCLHKGTATLFVGPPMLRMQTFESIDTLIKSFMLHNNILTTHVFPIYAQLGC